MGSCKLKICCEMELDTFCTWGALPKLGYTKQAWSLVVQEVLSKPLLLMLEGSAVLVWELLNLIYEFSFLHVPKPILLLVHRKRFRIMGLVRLTVFFSFQGSLADFLSLVVYDIWKGIPSPVGRSCTNKCKVSLSPLGIFISWPFLIYCSSVQRLRSIIAVYIIL